MTTVYTTTRGISVKESYEYIISCFLNENTFIELTEVITYYPELIGEVTKTETKTILNKSHIIEVINHDLD